jgi:hypothetical protein
MNFHYKLQNKKSYFKCMINEQGMIQEMINLPVKWKVWLAEFPQASPTCNSNSKVPSCVGDPIRRTSLNSLISNESPGGRIPARRLEVRGDPTAKRECSYR